MGAPKNRGYKRSWKNYLLNARYQLRFTLLMVAICALLMAGLGWWVMRAADKATTVSMDNVLGVACQKPETSARGARSQVEIEPGAAPVAPTVDDEDAGEVEVEVDGEVEERAVEPEDGGEGDADEPEREPARDRKAPVLGDIVEEDVPPPPPPPPPVAAIARYRLCRAQQASTIERLRVNRDRILYVLIGAGVLLCLGLAVYGIKMTHRVAGPLHKVGLYFAKMRDGKYDTVYNLRKGDQLVAFYEHFKEAHEGTRKVETEDVEMLRDLIAAADAGKVAEKSAAAKAALDELRAVLAKKEDAIG